MAKILFKQGNELSSIYWSFWSLLLDSVADVEEYVNHYLEKTRDVLEFNPAQITLLCLLTVYCLEVSN